MEQPPFTLSREEIIFRRMKDFHRERVSAVLNAEVPLTERDGGILVLHLIPESCVVKRKTLDGATLKEHGARIRPLGNRGGTCNPEPLLKGDDFRELRRLRRKARENHHAQSDWQNAWEKRLQDWQRKRLYDGLEKVFLAYCRDAHLKTPSTFQHTTLETWSEVIEAIKVLRNCLTHGASTVPTNLAEFSGKQYCLGFNFEEGHRLLVELYHLQAIQPFCEQLLSGLNLSLVERAGHPISHTT